MSDNEFHYGRLKKLDMDEDQIEEFFEMKCQEEGRDKLPYESWYKTYLWYISNQKYFLVKGSLYEVIEHQKEEDYYWNKLIPNLDGTITFLMGFYNGGTDFTECLEESLKDLE